MVENFPKIPPSDIEGLPERLALEQAHRTSTANPHSVTKTQVGLSEVPNWNVLASWGKNPYGLYFDGVDDYVSFGNVLANLADYDCSIAIEAEIVSTSANQQLFCKRISSTTGYWLYLNSSLQVVFAIGSYDGTFRTATFTTTNPLTTGNHHIVLVKSTNTLSNWKFYIDGALVTANTSGIVSGIIANTEPLTIGKFSSYNQDYLKGRVYGLKVFDYALGDNQVKTLYNNGVPALADTEFIDKDGSYTELASGTLVKGYRYYIKTFNTGDDFVNVGAATNASGVTFVATGTTPTTWTNGSVLFRVGRVLDLNFAEASNITLPDKTAARLHGAISGALPISRALISPANKTGITGNSTITTGNRQGYSVDFITVKNNNGTNTVSVNIGSTANGTEYGQVTDLAAGATTVIVANKYLAHSANQNIYIYPTGTNVNIDVLTSQTRRS